MKIMQSALAMASSREYAVSHQIRESLVVRRQPESPKTPPAKEISPISDLDPLETFKAKLLALLIEKLTGKPFDFLTLDPTQLPDEEDLTSFLARLGDLKAASPKKENKESQENWGFRYEYHESYREQETTAFAAAGIVKTSDGREIDFSVGLKMSREFIQENDIQVGNLKDPLVVNFSGTAAELTRTKFRFDLDADGEKDQISFLKPGSGFLALDKNGNGEIDDGKELFGPQSGNGFSELASLDEDENGWIDENDSIFSKLRIWTKNEQGEDKLLGLGEAGVGAVFLGHISTPFSLKDARGDWMGQVRDSGVFLREDGTPGTVQQIDLSL
ncbi:MAG TPA: hypothetical protein DD435_05130 [Cyanobacteria bacterium UBA8530]|nr:hypothetical protein [Cyanobacteria bacterium UBA8530]